MQLELSLVFILVSFEVVLSIDPVHKLPNAHLWGSYIPGLHIGARAQRSKSLVTSVGWSNLEGTVFRHSSKGESLYSPWTHHDGNGFGKQIIHDSEPSINSKIKTDFISNVKLECTKESNCMQIHSHHHSIRVTRIGSSQMTHPISIFTSIGLEDDDLENGLQMIGSFMLSTPNRGDQEAGDDYQLNSGFFFQGRSSDALIGEFLISVEMKGFNHSNEPVLNYSISSLPIPASDYAWNLPWFVQRHGKKSLVVVDPLKGGISKWLSKLESTKLKTMANRMTDRKSLDHLLSNISTAIQLKNIQQTSEEQGPKRSHKMAVIQATIQMTELSNFDINIDLFSSPYSEKNSTSTLLHRLGFRSCPNHGSSNALPECFSNAKKFLFDFFENDRDFWISSRMKLRQQSFESKMKELFFSDLPDRAHIESRPDPLTRVSLQNVTRFAISNLLGGYGYFQGRLKVRIAKDLEVDSLEPVPVVTTDSIPLSLFSGTPSRSKFPWPFLWDEGFHLSVLRLWDYRLFLGVLRSWFNLQFDHNSNNYLSSRLTKKESISLNLSIWNGWIPREPSLGLITQSLIPIDFQYQDVRVANPPTLLFPLIDHIRLVKEVQHFLNRDVSNQTISVPILKLLRSLDLSTECFALAAHVHRMQTQCLPISTAGFRQSPPNQCSCYHSALIHVVQETHEFISQYNSHIVKWFYYFRRTQRSKRSIFLIEGKQIPLYRCLFDHLIIHWLLDSTMLQEDCG